ncbi:MAG: SpoIIE family protein phosphatase [Candidatus Poribacteria bacterium]|nr:SpoIIE family protein phosphatase [Candidatus Poribacteria bacterium]
MRKKIMKLLACLLTLLITVRCAPASDPIEHWKAYTIVDGLAGGNVRAILEDKRGNLWIATDGDGVSRYDGQSFRNLTKQDGLAENFVRAILEDTKDNLWFATWGGGVCQYTNEGFEITLDVQAGLIDNYVTSMTEDRAGNLWFATKGGVSRYDGQDFTNFTIEHGLPENYVKSISEDSQGNIWLGTWSGSVCKYDGQSFQTFNIGKNRVNSILEDSEGNLWFGTYGDGIYNYDGAHFQQFTVESNDLADNRVSAAILEDSQGDLWFGTDSGASKYDGQNFQNFTSRDGLVGNQVTSIIEDREGNLWFGTWGAGICRYDNKIQHYFQSGAVVKHGLEDRRGNLWFITQGAGIMRYDGFQVLTVKDGRINDANSKIVADKDGNLWFGGWGGLTKHDGSGFQLIQDAALANTRADVLLGDGKGNLWFAVWQHQKTIKIGKYDGKDFRHFPIEGKMRAFAALEDREGNVWFGTDYGVYRYNDSGFEHLTMADGLGSNSISSIAEDTEGNIWFGLRFNDRPGAEGFGGLSMYNGTEFQTYSTEDGLASNAVEAIWKDRKGALWFGTWHGGVSKYDGTRFQTFTTKDGLASNTIRWISEDKAGNLWFGSQGAGVSKYDGTNFQTLTTADGLINNTASVVLADSSGDIWFRYEVAGLTKYTPAKGIFPHIEITQILAGKIYPPDQKVEVPTKTSVVFHYKGLSLKTQFSNIRYVYKLEGYDEAWSASTLKRAATYENLKPGTYIFRVRAIDRDLNYSNPPAIQELIVQPPFYMTAKFAVPAVTLALILVAGLCLCAFRFHLHRKIMSELRESLKQHQDLERQRITSELQDAHDMQMKLMPEAPPKIDDFDIFGKCQPANEVGGDFFNYIWQAQDRNRLAIALADVSGKGMRAAMTAIMTDGMLHTEAKLRWRSAGQLLSELNVGLYERTDERTFVAFCLASVNIKEKMLQFSNAGLSWPLIKRGKKVLTIAESSGFPLGIKADTLYEDTVIALEEEDIVVFCTDGIVETLNEKDEMYGFEGLEETVRKAAHGLSATQFVDHILKDVEMFRGSADQYDDMTVVILKVNGKKEVT